MEIKAEIKKRQIKAEISTKKINVTLTGKGGATKISNLTDVSISNLQDGESLVYNSTTEKWENSESSGVTNHAELTNLDYASSGHTGFQPSGDYLESGDNVSELTNDAGYLTTESDPIFSNSPAFDVIDSGDGSQFLSDDGTYKTVSTADEKVKYDSEDPIAGYVSDKIIAGDGISIAEGTGTDENKLVITNDDKGSDVDLSGLVPYTGATGSVDLGNNTIEATKFIIGGTTDNLGFVKNPVNQEVNLQKDDGTLGTLVIGRIASGDLVSKDFFDLYIQDIFDTKNPKINFWRANTLRASIADSPKFDTLLGVIPATPSQFKITGSVDYDSVTGKSKEFIVDSFAGGVHFANDVSVGTGTSYANVFRYDSVIPTARFNIGAGSTTKAPLKFTTGSLLTTPQSGTIEYYDGDFYLQSDGLIVGGDISADNLSGTNTGDQEASDFDIKDLTDSTNLMTTWSSKEDSLGNPDVDGYVLSSTTDGVRSWVAQSVGASFDQDLNTTDEVEFASVKTPTIYNTDGVIYIDVDSGEIEDGTNTSIHWINRDMYDTSGVESIDYEDRLLKDSVGRYSVDWTTYNLIYDDGNELKNMFNWKDLAFPTLTINGILNVSSGDGTISVVPLLLSENSGSVQFDIADEGSSFITLQADGNGTGNVQIGHSLELQTLSGTDGILDISSGVVGVNNNVTKKTIGFTTDGAGSAITTGVKGYFRVPYSGTIKSVQLLANPSGSCVVDIWKSASGIPTNSDSITGGNEPELSSAQTFNDTTLTDWTTSVSAGDYFAYNIDSASTIQRLTLILEIEND